MKYDVKALKKYPDIMDAKQVAEVFGVHTATVTTTLTRDGLRSFRVGRGEKSPFRFFKADVIDFIRANAFRPKRGAQR